VRGRARYRRTGSGSGDDRSPASTDTNSSSGSVSDAGAGASPSTFQSSSEYSASPVATPHSTGKSGASLIPAANSGALRRRLADLGVHGADVLSLSLLSGSGGGGLLGGGGGLLGGGGGLLGGGGGGGLLGGGAGLLSGGGSSTPIPYGGSAGGSGGGGGSGGMHASGARRGTPARSSGADVVDVTAMPPRGSGLAPPH